MPPGREVAHQRLVELVGFQREEVGTVGLGHGWEGRACGVFLNGVRGSLNLAAFRRPLKAAPSPPEGARIR